MLQAARAVPRACPLYVRAVVCWSLTLSLPLVLSILIYFYLVLKAEPLNWGNSVLPLRVDIRSIVNRPCSTYRAPDWLSHPRTLRVTHKTPSAPLSYGFPYLLRFNKEPKQGTLASAILARSPRPQGNVSRGVVSFVSRRIDKR